MRIIWADNEPAGGLIPEQEEKKEETAKAEEYSLPRTEGLPLSADACDNLPTGTFGLGGGE